MLSQLKRVSRRITDAIKSLDSGDKAIGGSVAKKSAKSSKTKTAAKPAKSAKPAAKPTAKSPVKASGKSPVKASVKSSSKAVIKAAPKTNSKAPAKVPPKVPANVAAPKGAKAGNGKAAVEKSSKAPSPGKAAPIKTDKKLGKSSDAEESDESVNSEDFAGAEEFVADIAADLEATDAEAANESAEALTPSAVLLAAMKPTISDEKAAEKKKKKDDLKLDRGGDLEAQWQTLKDKNKAIKPLNYKMSETFEARTPILHKVLGWGFIITNQNDRLEVLFQQGIKFLISNYKA